MPNRPSREESKHRASASRLARLVRERRAERGLSQQELATSASMSIGTVRAMEQVRTVDPSFFTVVELLRVLEIDVTEALREITAVGDDGR